MTITLVGRDDELESIGAFLGRIVTRRGYPVTLVVGRRQRLGGLTVQSQRL